MRQEGVDYTITPILCGEVEAEWSNLTFKQHMGERVKVPLIMWIVSGAGRIVVMDSGPGDPETVKAITGRDLVRDEEPEAALARLRIRPRDVEALVLSHLHWDHAGGTNLFPDAPIYVQRSELHWAIAPLPAYERSYEWKLPGGDLPRWLYSRHRMKVVDGDFPLAAGLDLIHLPGHTPGCMGLCCETRGGRHLIACDAAPTYENLESGVPPGWYVDLHDAYRSLERCRSVADVVLPCHDMRVLQAGRYPRSGE